MTALAIVSLALVALWLGANIVALLLLWRSHWHEPPGAEREGHHG